MDRGERILCDEAFAELDNIEQIGPAVALAIAGIWIEFVPGSSYWDVDGTLAGVGLINFSIVAGLLISFALFCLRTFGPAEKIKKVSKK